TGPGMGERLLSVFEQVPSVSFLPKGFAEMVIVDPTGFDRQHYDFEFVRREFLGEVRALVFDARPKKNAGKDRFTGRMWVEDQDYNIVRFNGKFGAPNAKKFLHFDSWRVRTGPGLWLPAYIYSEESDLKPKIGKSLHYKSQT